MLVYTITEKESCTCEPKTVYQTRTCTERTLDYGGQVRHSTTAYTTQIVSSNCNSTAITSVNIKGEESGQPTGGGIGCNNYVNFTKIFYLSNGQQTYEEKGITNVSCDYTETFLDYNTPRVQSRIIISTSTTESNTVQTVSTINDYGTVPIGTLIDGKLSTKLEFTQITTASFKNTTTTVKNTVTSSVDWTFGYSNAEGGYSPAVTPNFVSTRIELTQGEGVWYPTVNLSQFTDKSNIDIKEIMTYKEFPATIDIHPYLLSSNGAIAEASCNSNGFCTAPKLSTSSSRETKTETFTSSSSKNTTYSTNYGASTFPLKTLTIQGQIKTTQTSQFFKTNILVTNVNKFTQYTTAQSTFKVSLGEVSWAEIYTNIQTTETTIASSLTYTASETANFANVCKTTRKLTWSELYRVSPRANPSVFNPIEIKKYFLYGQAVPGVTNNFNLEVKAGNLTLEKVSYGSYIPNIRVLLPLKYTYSSSTALVDGAGIKLTIKKASGIETTSYPFSPNGNVITKQVYIKAANTCDNGFFIGGVSPNGKITDSIERLSIEGLYASLTAYSSNKELKQESEQKSVPTENSTAYYPLNSNKFYVVLSNNTDFYISTKRNTELNNFLKTLSCRNSSYSVNVLYL